MELLLSNNRAREDTESVLNADEHDRSANKKKRKGNAVKGEKTFHSASINGASLERKEGEFFFACSSPRAIIRATPFITRYQDIALPFASLA